MCTLIIRIHIDTDDPVFTVHIAEVLNRVDEVQQQLQSYIRHQQVSIACSLLDLFVFVE